jgi:hypothetical protein
MGGKWIGKNNGEGRQGKAEDQKKIMGKRKKKRVNTKRRRKK